MLNGKISASSLQHLRELLSESSIV